MKNQSAKTLPASPPRQRLIETATRLFYLNGIHSIGVDRIIAESGVAKATFYNHFPSKDDLVKTYIEEQDKIGRAAVAQLPDKPPRELIISMLERIVDAAATENFRGCPFLNAAAEYADPGSPVRQAIAARRRWYHGRIRDLASSAGIARPSIAASLLVALSDGLLEIGYLEGPELLPVLLHEGAQRILGGG
ncbi:TetR family transcriptional regulator [Hoeflea marina]|uniref:TetR family transcriptional regulator n=1 Tax=Hoeflea marina TaxID=274592 RepID=A0A317PK62_9HYPH|nr:TetR/AcrR family transcriptional regulator [Hoeflea marina]PWW01362.1 TetR family transcriptional regulator [Hoeflea marina]